MIDDITNLPRTLDTGHRPRCRRWNVLPRSPKKKKLRTRVEPRFRHSGHCAERGRPASSGGRGWQTDPFAFLLPIRAREGIKTHARDDSLLIDLGQLKRIISLDAKARSATIQSAVRGRELNAALAKSGLAFPVGHCPTVSLSGFLLNGGLGWNFGGWGPGIPSRARGSRCFSALRTARISQ